jgi:hypothetical protein
MTMRLFSRKKTSKQHDVATNKQLEKSGGATNNARDLKTPTAASKSLPTSAALHPATTSRSQPPVQRQHVHMTGVRAGKAATLIPPKQRNQSTSVAEHPKQSQSPPSQSSNNESLPISNTISATDKYYEQKRTAQDSNNGIPSSERNKPTATTPPNNIRSTNTPVKPSPRSILHTHHEHTQQHAKFAMDTPEAHHPPNRVRFLSSNSSVASSSCASEVHLMAGPGSVASSSAMSSSKGEGENVFDRVLHSVMAEEEDRLKAMGMSKAGSSTGMMSPAMYYKSPESPGMYYRGGNRGVSSSGSDEFSPQEKLSAKVQVAAAAGRLIDIDTGMTINSTCSSGNVECEYHDLHDDDAIDTKKYMTLLSHGSGGNHHNLNESTTSADSDGAVTGSMTFYNRALPSNRGGLPDGTEQYPLPRTQGSARRF